jgi:hypothetical protein
MSLVIFAFKDTDKLMNWTVFGSPPEQASVTSPTKSVLLTLRISGTAGELGWHWMEPDCATAESVAPTSAKKNKNVIRPFGTSLTPA